MVTARAARNAGTAGRLAIAAALAVLQAVVAPLPVRAEDDCITIADFATDPIGAFPPGWQVRKDEGKSVYSVKEDGGRRYIRAVSKGLGIQGALESAWDLDAYPVLPCSSCRRQVPSRVRA